MTRESCLTRWWRSVRRDYGPGMTYAEWEAYKAKVFADMKANWHNERGTCMDCDQPMRLHPPERAERCGADLCAQVPNRIGDDPQSRRRLTTALVEIIYNHAPEGADVVELALHTPSLTATEVEAVRAYFGRGSDRSQETTPTEAVNHAH